MAEIPNIPVEISHPNLPFHFDKLVHCPTSLHLCREFGKGIKNVRAIPFGWPVLIGKCRNPFSLGIPTGF